MCVLAGIQGDCIAILYPFEDGLNSNRLVFEFSDELQSELMKEVVDYLIIEYNLISEISPLPYVPGKKKAIINDQPRHPDGEGEMRNYKTLSNGYYIDTHMNASGKKRIISPLADICGIGVEYDGEW